MKEARKYDVQIIWVKPRAKLQVQRACNVGDKEAWWVDRVSWREREEEEAIARSSGVLQAILRSGALTVSNVLARSVWLLF